MTFSPTLQTKSIVAALLMLAFQPFALAQDSTSNYFEGDFTSLLAKMKVENKAAILFFNADLYGYASNDEVSQILKKGFIYYRIDPFSGIGTILQPLYQVDGQCEYPVIDSLGRKLAVLSQSLKKNEVLFILGKVHANPQPKEVNISPVLSDFETTKKELAEYKKKKQRGDLLSTKEKQHLLILAHYLGQQETNICEDYFQDLSEEERLDSVNVTLYLHHFDSFDSKVGSFIFDKCLSPKTIRTANFMNVLNTIEKAAYDTKDETLLKKNRSIWTKMYEPIGDQHLLNDQLHFIMFYAETGNKANYLKEVDTFYKAIKNRKPIIDTFSTCGYKSTFNTIDIFKNTLVQTLFNTRLELNAMEIEQGIEWTKKLQPTTVRLELQEKIYKKSGNTKMAEKTHKKLVKLSEAKKFEGTTLRANIRRL